MASFDTLKRGRQIVTKLILLLFVVTFLWIAGVGTVERIDSNRAFRCWDTTGMRIDALRARLMDGKFSLIDQNESILRAQKNNFGWGVMYPLVCCFKNKSGFVTEVFAYEMKPYYEQQDECPF